MACTWTGFVLGPQMQLGDMTTTNTVVVGNNLPKSYPIAQPGTAHAGAEVYRANGCNACHTQMVRPQALGSDINHGWGARRSLAEDYLFEQPVMTGSVRIGPDLSNVGNKFDTNNVAGAYLRLYAPELITPKTVMPSYKFLFEKRKIGFFRSPDAVSLPDQVAPPPGYEIVPTDEAKALVSYMMNLTRTVICLKRRRRRFRATPCRQMLSPQLKPV